MLVLLLHEHTKNSNSRTIETNTNTSNEDTSQGYPILPARRILECTCTATLPFLHFGPNFFPHTQQQWKPRGARRQELQQRNKKPRISKARRQNKCPLPQTKENRMSKNPLVKQETQWPSFKDSSATHTQSKDD